TIAVMVATQVLAAVTTSSPGPTPCERNARAIASVPELTPTACAAPQYEAQASSNRSTAGPPTKRARRRTSAKPSSSSPAIAAAWRLRPTTGTLTGRPASRGRERRSPVEAPVLAVVVERAGEALAQAHPWCPAEPLADLRVVGDVVADVDGEPLLREG